MSLLFKQALKRKIMKENFPPSCTYVLSCFFAENRPLSSFKFKEHLGKGNADVENIGFFHVPGRIKGCSLRR